MCQKAGLGFKLLIVKGLCADFRRRNFVFFSLYRHSMNLGCAFYVGWGVFWAGGLDILLVPGLDGVFRCSQVLRK